MTMLKTNESGRSMIEMLGVLAIIGVLSVGGIAGYSKAMNKFKTNKVADNVSMLVANIKTMYAQQKTYGGLTTTTAHDMGLVPDELVKKSGNATSYKNAYNGDVEIHAASSTNGTTSDSKAFVIYFGGLSKEACITLATNDWGSGYSSGLIALQAAATSDAANANDVKNALDLIVIGDNASAVATTTVGSEKAIAMPGANGSGQLAVPMSVSAAANACACNTGNKCSITWKYY